MKSRIVLLATILLCWPATAADSPLPPLPAFPRNDIPGVKNFAKISDTLYRGEQPTAEGFAELKKRGIKTVVCLRSFHGDEPKLTGLGLQYVSIRCQAWHPEEEDVVEFMHLVRDPKNQPVFVHCLHGADRTGMMVAAYRILEDHWTNDQAIQESHNFGFHEIFSGIKKYLQTFDKTKVNALIEKSTAPKFKVVE